MINFSQNLQKLFDKIIDFVFGIILFFIIVSLAIGSIQLVQSVWALFRFEGITGHYIGLITDVLTLYILVELSRSLVDYFHHRKIRITFIVDAAIVFIIREILIALFKHKIEVDMIYALSALLLVLSALRISSILVYQREIKMNQTGSSV
jgi:uncharacterized membrane protein (DUF373 family)